MELSVIVPCFHSELVLSSVVEEMILAFSKCFREFEVICIDDGSRDGTWQVIQQLSVRFIEVRGIRLSRNFGQWAATLCGINDSRGEIFITLDADGQYDPKDALLLIFRVKGGGFDAASGIRDRPRNSLLSKVFKVFLEKAHCSSMVVLRRSLLNQDHGVNPLGMALDPYMKWIVSPHRVSLQIIEFRKRQNAKTSYRFSARVRLITNNVFDYCGPRELALLSGLIWTPLFILTSLRVASLILCGIFLILILGYVSEIYLHLKGKPLYQVVERCDACCESM